MTPYNDNNDAVPMLSADTLNSMIDRAMLHAQEEPQAPILHFPRQSTARWGSGFALAACLAALMFTIPVNRNLSFDPQAQEDIADMMVLETFEFAALPIE